MLNGDENQLKTLFVNIIDNAIKYTPPKGEIRVNTKRDKSLVRIAVEDAGIGIPPDEVTRIFDRFYRSDKSRNSLGFGLGLSISKSIVEAHGGTISVKSRPGEGTVFTVMLPLP